MDDPANPVPTISSDSRIVNAEITIDKTQSASSSSAISATTKITFQLGQTSLSENMSLPPGCNDVVLGRA